MSQDTASSVRDLLPDFCFLNLEDDDYATLGSVLDVDVDYYKATDITDNELSGNEFDIGGDGVVEVAGDDEFDYGAEDVRYFEEVSGFMANGCGCKLATGKSILY